MNKIELKFDNTLTRLAGNPFGYKIYCEQVKDKINWDGVNEIIFPDSIERIAISFIQGFSKDILKEIDKNEVEKLIVIHAKDRELEDKILQNLKF